MRIRMTSATDNSWLNGSISTLSNEPAKKKVKQWTAAGLGRFLEISSFIRVYCTKPEFRFVHLWIKIAGIQVCLLWNSGFPKPECEQTVVQPANTPSASLDTVCPVHHHKKTTTDCFVIVLHRRNHLKIMKRMLTLDFRKHTVIKILILLSDFFWKGVTYIVGLVRRITGFYTAGKLAISLCGKTHLSINVLRPLKAISENWISLCWPDVRSGILIMLRIWNTLFYYHTIINKNAFRSSGRH